jgi:hypothetical protein
MRETVSRVLLCAKMIKMIMKMADFAIHTSGDVTTSGHYSGMKARWTLSRHDSCNALRLSDIMGTATNRHRLKRARFDLRAAWLLGWRYRGVLGTI